MQDVTLVLQMPQYAYAWMNSLVVPALCINGIGTKHLQFTAFNLRSKSADHTPVLVFEKFPHRCGEDEKRSSGVAEDEGFHVAMQFLAVTLVIFAIHQVCSGKLQAKPALCSRSILPDGMRKTLVCGSWQAKSPPLARGARRGVRGEGLKIR